MGSCYSSEDRVAPREMNVLNTGEERPTATERNERKIKDQYNTTDVTFLVLMGFFYLILSGFITYCIYHGDLYRIINGYDNCGNVCGRENVREKYDCSGVNMTNKPFLLVRGSSGFSVIPTQIDRECVINCKIYPNYEEFLNRCIPKRNKQVINTIFSKTGLRNFFQEVSEDFSLCWKEVIYLCLTALVFSVIIMILLRYLVGVVVWLVLFGVCVSSVVGTVYLWLLWIFEKSDMDEQPENQIPVVDSRKIYTYLAFAIIASIITTMVLLLIFVMRKRIQLVIVLFKEAGKALAEMPLLLFEPILTFIALAIIISLWFYFAMWIASAGFIEESRIYFIYYEKDFWMKFTRWYNLLGMFWLCQFVIGCQHMIVAGAVSKWYFTRNNIYVGLPVLESAFYLVRYYLGSVALGSLLIALVQLIRVILATVQKYLKNKQGKCANTALKCCQCCIYCFEKILKYLNRNAYILVAMRGYSFCKAGKEAFELLVNNALHVVAINSVGDFVLFLGKVLVVICTVLIGLKVLENKEGLQHVWVPVTLVGLFAYFISHCFLTVYEMAIDTIFLCFCRDCKINDGINRPYFMPKGMMQFIEISKKVLKIRDETRRGPQAWQQGRIATIS